MPTETMTSRERWLAVLRHEVPDRVPLDYWGTGEASEKLMKHLGLPTWDAVRKRLRLDYVVGVGGHYAGPPAKPGEDIFGCRHQQAQHEGGSYTECIHHPLAQFNSVEEIEANYAWPNPDSWTYTHLRDAVKGKEHLPVSGGGSEPFLFYTILRGMEQAFMDLSLNPEIVHYCLDKLFHLAYENTRRIYEQIPGVVVYSYIAEDLGSQEGLLMSPAHIREFLLPRMKKMMDLAHQAGVYVFHHSDGAVRDILPEIVDTGIDILNPIQWRCNGMDREALKRDFGQRIVFHGAVDNQFTLPFGSIDEVRQEVLDNIRILGKGGGYVLAPCHNIQVVSPAENIVAMYDAAYEHGWYK